MDRIANTDVPEIEVTPEMIEAGTLAFVAYDYRFEPAEAAAVKVFQAMVAVSSELGGRVVLASEVGRYLSPYLERQEGT